MVYLLPVSAYSVDGIPPTHTFTRLVGDSFWILVLSFTAIFHRCLSLAPGFLPGHALSSFITL